jgi:hypothetical protein
MRAGVVVSGALISFLAPLSFLALFVFSAGCTFLISFDDVASSDAGATDTSTSSTRNDTGTVDPPVVGDAGDSGPPIDVPDTCDDQFPLGQITGCEDYVQNGQVCANTSTLKFPADYDASRDVITCSKVPTPRAICIKHCRGPGGCAHNPAGIPDQCDQCAGKANGTHCGSEMAGWPSDTFKVLVTCTDNRMTKSAACAASCSTNGGTGGAKCN